jgi:LPXTG-motif cell wall-anchored protein
MALKFKSGEDSMMKTQSIITRKSRAALVALSGIGVALGLAEFSAQADQWDKRTVLTVNEPMQIRETLLEPGQYVLKLLNSSSERHIVQIYNADQTHLINTVMAIPDYRLQATGGSRFAMWETPEGSAKALKAWFYPGDNFGQEFPYPKHLQQIAFAQPAPTPAPPPPAAAPVPQEPAIQPQASVQQPPPSQGPVEIAQNSPPPPAPAAPEAPPQSPVSTTPAELPKTASPYPMFGLAGLLLLGVGGLLRQTHSA